MGLTKQFLLEEADRERWREATKWLCDKRGRRVTHAEVRAAWNQFELEEAMADRND